MSRLVDERVVELSFDNRDFEKHTKESMQTIDKLKDSMDFSDVAKSMNKSFDSVDTSVLMQSLNKVSSGFSSLEVVAITAISNITNKLVNLGVQLAKSLSIDNISAGWSKFSDTTISTGTLISQGYAIEDVTEQMERLQFFTDETSYTFTDMVSNISKFTAAGQKLDDSVDAMMGIANWAALSGQNAQTASRAMYQLSQAMGAGVVRLQDYRSIQSANMDTQEFRQNVLDTAVAMGQLNETIDGMYSTLSGKSFDINQFTEQLSEGWFTSDVLTQTLKKYSSSVDDIYEYTKKYGVTASEAIEALKDDLDAFGKKAFEAAQEARTFADVISSVKEASASGFQSIFESIFGNYEEAKVLWTDLANELYDLFVQPIKDISQAFAVWKEEGRDLLFANTEEARGAFWDIYYAIAEIVNIVKGSLVKALGLGDMDDMVGVVQNIASKLLEITKRIKEFTSQLVLREDFAYRVQSIINGLVSSFKLIFKLTSSILKATKPVADFIIRTARNAINFVSMLLDKFSEFVATTTFFDDLEKLLTNIFEDIVKIAEEVNVFGLLKDLFETFFINLESSGGTLENIIKILKGALSLVGIIINVVGRIVTFINDNVLPVIYPILNDLVTIIPEFIGTIIEWLADLGEFLVNLYDMFKNGESLGEIAKFLSESFTAFLQSLTEFFNKLSTFINFNTVSDILKDVFGVLSELAEPLSELFHALLDLFKEGLIVLKEVMPLVTAIIKILSKALSTLAKNLESLFSKLDPEVVLKILSFVVFLLVAAIAIKWTIDTIKFVIDPIVHTMESISDVLYGFSTESYARAFKNVATAIFIIASAIALIGTIEKDRLLGAVLVFALIGTFVVVILKTLEKMAESATDVKKMNRTLWQLAKIAGVLMLFAAAMVAATVPFLLLATLSVKQMSIALIGVAAIFTELLLLDKIAKKIEIKNILKAAFSIGAVGFAMNAMVTPFMLLGQMNFGELLVGVTAMLSIIALLAVFNLLSKKLDYKNISKVSFALSLFGFGMLVASLPLIALSKLDFTQILVAFSGIILMMSMLLLASIISKQVKLASILKFSVSLSVLALSMLISSKMFENLGNIEFDKVLSAILVMIVMTAAVIVLGKLFEALKPYIGYIFLGLAVISFLAVSMLITSVALQNVGKAIDGAIEPFERLGKMSWENILKSILSLIVLILTMAVLAAMGPVILGVLATAYTIKEIGNALNDMADSILKLTDIPWARAKVAMDNLYKVLAVFVGISLLLGTGGATTLVLLATSLMIFGESLGVIANGIYPFVAALEYLDQIEWGKLTSSIGKFLLICLGLATAALILAPAILVLGVAISVVLALMAPAIVLIVTSLTTLILAFTALVAVLDKLNGDKVANNIKKIVGAIKSVLPDIVDIINTILDTFIAKAPEFIALAVYLFEEMFAAGLQTFAESFGAIIEVLEGLVFEYGDRINAMVSYIIVNAIVNAVEALAGEAERLTAGIMKLLTNLMRGFNKNRDSFNEEFDKFISNLLTDFFIRGLELLPKILVSFVDAIATVFINFINDVADSIEKNSKALYEAFWNLYLAIKDAITKYSFGSFMKNIARDLIAGLFEGLRDAVGGTQTIVGRWIDTVIVQPIRKKLEINSPSKVMERFGEYTAEGFAIGLLAGGSEIKDSVESLSDNVIDGTRSNPINDALNTMIDSLTSNIDTTIVITPILDLSEIQNGVGSMYSMFDTANAYAFSGSSDYATSTIGNAQTSKNNRYFDAQAKTTQTVKTEPTTINNTFNITGDNAQDIANEVSRIIQVQTERRNAAWGV